MFRLYIACLASYNAGVLYGKWIEVAGQTGDELRQEIAEILKGSKEPFAEEWAIHDHEGFDGLHVSENHDLDELAEYVDVLYSSEHEDELIHGVASHLGCGAREAVDYIEENYAGEWDNLECWAIEFLEETSELQALPKHLQYYFDYAAFARDSETNGDILTIDSKKGVYVLWNR